MTSRKSFLLRIDPRLHEELEAWARQELRSVNGQIEFLLREAVARRRGGSLSALEEGDPRTRSAKSD
ncbi:MAG: toxin-antitoxin system HicB family antitoxin [Pirellulales bacterium]|jgi:hypothetical protein|nr:toxin-antitoxin system HicB family antitoxin [Thermoguttaceae bacterium]MDD4788655.1 toxin-antitoxin system HicB family antitoxin [Pirellulales bacterium]MDI9446318.1 toxin-antitoxin system HicB family antitoxin [Planctomycetota bacterium]NLZ03263.1 toxin-antitoxin system HicB family antitoxin [Pirellulaceae bacterium]